MMTNPGFHLGVGQIERSIFTDHLGVPQLHLFQMNSAKNLKPSQFTSDFR